MGKINFEDKIGVVPKQTRKNQVWDDDINEIKAAINENYSGSIFSINGNGDKTGLAVFGKGIPAINTGGFFIGISSVANPSTDADFSEFLLEL
jgi:hypothetical protein